VSQKNGTDIFTLTPSVSWDDHPTSCHLHIGILLKHTVPRQQASTRSSSVHLLYLFLKQLSIVLYLIKAFLFAGIVYFFIRW